MLLNNTQATGKKMPVEEVNPPTRKQRRAQRRASMNEAENEKEEEMMEIPIAELEARPDDTPRPQPDGEIQ